MTIERTSQTGRFGRVIGTPLALLALVGTTACAARDGVNASSLPVSTAAAQPAGSPVLVSCEPNQRTLVRPVVVNGAALSQIECITNAATPATQPVALQAPLAAEPVYQAAPVYRQARYEPQASSALPDARVVSAPEPQTAARPVPVRQTVYNDARPARPTRSVKKSVVIIGSSAGVGAGVGAAIGGKKGALLGAAIGGGGATLWDQLTRRDR
jgi:hypothetical protein